MKLSTEMEFFMRQKTNVIDIQIIINLNKKTKKTSANRKCTRSFTKLNLQRQQKREEEINKNKQITVYVFVFCIK